MFRTTVSSVSAPLAGFTAAQADALAKLKDAYTHSVPYSNEYDWLPPRLVFTRVELNRLNFVKSLVTGGRIGF